MIDCLGALESVPGLRALPVVWKSFLGDAFLPFKTAFLVHQSPSRVRSFPCSKCGCDHRIVRHAVDSIVAVCQCDPPCCDDIVLSNNDLITLSFNPKSFTGAVAKALSFDSRYSALKTPFSWQIGEYSTDHIHVILSIQPSEDEYLATISELVLSLRKKFLLLVPTRRFVTARLIELLQRCNAGVFALSDLLVFLTNGSFSTRDYAHEVLHDFHKPKPVEDPDSVVSTALLLIAKLDSEPRRSDPSHVDFFRLYCCENYSLGDFVKKNICSKGTASNRKTDIERILNRPLDSFRQYSDTIEQMDALYHENKARRIYIKGLAS